MLSFQHLLLLIAVVVLLFGAGRISGLMGDVAKGIKSFKKGLAEDDEGDKAKPVKSIDHEAAKSATTDSVRDAKT